MFFSPHRKKTTSFFLCLALFIAGIISFSPYTITRLITHAEDVPALLNDPPEYIRLQDELDKTTQETEQKLAEIVALDQKTSVVSDTTAAPSIDTSPSADVPTPDAVTPLTNDTATDSPTTETLTPIETSVPASEESSPSAIAPTLAQETTSLATEKTFVPVVPAPVFDPATAPASITLKVRMAETKKALKFPVTINFVAVGGKRTEVTADKDGNLSLSLASGRYYTEVAVSDSDYKLVGDGPAFFANANEEQDLGVVYITEKQ